MIVIIESGATKTELRCILRSGKMFEFRLGGINLASSDEAYLCDLIDDMASSVRELGEHADAIYMYAAGMVGGGMVSGGEIAVRERFKQHFPQGEIHMMSDIQGAAESVLGDEPGIALILGTGSGCCEYDGHSIIRKIYSGGYVLGDEGGAAALGRNFLADYIKGLLPDTVSNAFSIRYASGYEDIVGNIYKGTSPATYLGSFAPFILSFYSKDDYVKRLVDNNFKAFFERSVTRLWREGLKIGVVGSFGAACRDIVARISGDYGMKITRYVTSPVETLAMRHLKKMCDDDE